MKIFVEKNLFSLLALELTLYHKSKCIIEQ